MSSEGKVEAEKPRDLRILIAIPCHGNPTLPCLISVSRAMTHFATLPYDGAKDIQISSVKGPILPEVRRRLVSQAFAMNATHILWVDSDMEFPPDVITRLLNHAVAVVAANYPRKNLEARPTAYLESDDPENPYVGPVWTTDSSKGLQRVTVAGMGLMLTDMRVFETLQLPFFAFEPQKPDFVRDTGEDVYFCRELYKADIPIHIDHDLSKEVSHVGEFKYTNFISKEAEIVKQALYRDLPGS